MARKIRLREPRWVRKEPHQKNWWDKILEAWDNRDPQGTLKRIIELESEPANKGKYIAVWRKHTWVAEDFEGILDQLREATVDYQSYRELWRQTHIYYVLPEGMEQLLTTAG